MTYEELENELVRDITWRKREFTELSFINSSKMPDFRKEIILKASINLLYSHWEGHIKYSARKYIEYIVKQELSCSALTENFQKILVGKHFSNAQYNLNGNIDTQEKLYDFFNDTSLKFDVDKDKTIQTKSNLNYQRIEIILRQLGFPRNLFDPEKDFIDKKLIDARNAISHGDEQKIISHNIEDVYTQVKTKLLDMIQRFHDLILESAMNKKYLKSSTVESP
ncbi:TPA: hypothetical protein QB638_002137 [Pasteurella multocida]|nr:hypothetical protein [Pasteurella multocida]